MDMGNQSDISSSVHDSKFMDTYENSDIWYLNPNTQHFSTLPILTMKSFETIQKSTANKDQSKSLYASITSKNDLKKSLNKNQPSENAQEHQRIHFQLSHHLIDADKLSKNSDSDSDSDEEIKLNDSDDSESNNEQTEIANALEINLYFTKHEIKSYKDPIFLLDIDIKTQNIIFEISASSIIHLSSLFNPFEYFYNSSVDFALPNFKEFIKDANLLPTPEPAILEKQKPTPKRVILGDIRISQMPYISCLFLLFKDETQHLNRLYEEHMGNYVDQNHFITMDEYIQPNDQEERAHSYAFDMLLKYLQIHENLKKQEETLFSQLNLFFEAHEVSFYFEPNIRQIELSVDKTVVSLVTDINKQPICRFDELVINNVPPIVEKEIDLLDEEAKVEESPGPLQFYKQSLKSNQCFMINEEEELDDDYEDEIANKIEELNVIFERKKSNHIVNNKSVSVKHKKNYAHIEFSKGVYFGLTHTNLENLNELTDSLMNHIMQIKTIFYVSNSCFKDITENKNINSRMSDEKPSSEEDDVLEIDELLEGLDSPERLKKSMSNFLHKSSFKLDITLPKLQFDLLDESGKNAEAQVFSIYKEEPINPFDSRYTSKNLSDQNVDDSLTRPKLALLSFIIEKATFHLDILEEVNCPDETKKLKMGLILFDSILVNNLFL